MEKEYNNSKRPGRKALFVGATARPASAPEIKSEDPGKEFTALVLETIDKFCSGEKEARIQAENIPGEYTPAADSINGLLDTLASAAPGTGEENSGELESLLKDLEEKLGSSEEELETAREEVSRLNDIIKQKEDEIPETPEADLKELEDRYNSEIEELKQKILLKEEESLKRAEEIRAELEEKLQDAESGLKRAEEEKEQLSGRYEDRLKQQTQKASGLEETNGRLLKEIEKLKSESGKIDELNKKISQKEEEKRALHARITQAEEDKKKLVRQSGEKIEQYTNRIAILEDENKKLSEKLNELSLKEKTEKEEIRAKIAEVEVLKQRSETIVQQNPMPILLMNAGFDILVANSAYEEMSGISLHKITKMNARDFKILKQEGEGLGYAVKNKTRAKGEIEIEMPSGIHILEQYSIPILNNNKELKNILAVYNDITEIRRKDAEIEEIRQKEKEEAKILSESADIITEKMIGMTSGDLTVKAEIFKGDPLAVLKTNFNKSVEEFSNLISDINEKANILEGTSEELSTNSDDIARANENLALVSEESAEFLKDLMDRFEKINLSISDLSASIEEISSTSQEVTKQANQAAVEGKMQLK